MVLFAACDDDNATPEFDRPEVIAPSGIIDVENGAKGQSVTFDVTIDPELTGIYEAIGDNLTVVNANGDVDGNTVTINFDAGTTAGAASITL